MCLLSHVLTKAIALFVISKQLQSTRKVSKNKCVFMYNAGILLERARKQRASIVQAVACPSILPSLMKQSRTDQVPSEPRP